jgi:hypothetical protein
MEEMTEGLETLEAAVERLTLTAGNLEQMAGNLERQLHAQQAEQSKVGGRVGHIVAVDGDAEIAASASWEARLAEVERSLAEMRAANEMQAAATTRGGGQQGSGRRTLPVSTTNLLAKHGMGDAGPVEQGALDAALHSLPVEQRIAVKSQLLRAGLLG